MSDLVDRAAGVASVVGAGGRFASRRAAGSAPLGRGALPLCACGGRPGYAEYPARVAGRQAETLGCAACGRSVGPLSSRQALAAAWRLAADREG